MKKKILNILGEVSLVQFVPAIFVLSLIGNSILGYTSPKIVKETTASAKEQTSTKAISGEIKAELGDFDLSKIKDGTYIGEGNGFKGKVKVSVTVKSHKITEIKILSNEDDAAYFNRASKGVVQNILSKQSLDVDVVSGATYSSKGIIAAVKNALTGETDSSTTSNASATSSQSAGSTDVGTTTESGTYKDGTYTGSGTGFRGTIKVSVTIKSSKISSIKVLEFHDDEPYFGKAKQTLLPLIVSKQSTNVDAVSGATYSSKGIITAVRNALKKAEVTTSDSDSDGSNDSPSSSDKPSTNNTGETEEVTGIYKDGVYEGSAEGFGGDTTVSVTIKNKTIKGIEIIEENDDDSYFNKAKTLISKIIANKGTTNVDVVSGATYSSNGIIGAVNAALKKAIITDSSSSTENTNDASDSNDSSNTNDTPTDQTESVKKTYTGTATCSPDADLDFTEYELSLEITVLNRKVTGISNVSIQVDKDASWEEDVNKSYARSAFNGIKTQLLAGVSTSNVDIVSGATCSSHAVVEAYKNAVSQIK